MEDDERVIALGRLLASAGRAHHAEFGGPNDGWPEWYAAQVHPAIHEYVDSEPSVDEVAEWLREADVRHRAGAPDERWPRYYARVILESLDTPE